MDGRLPHSPSGTKESLSPTIHRLWATGRDYSGVSKTVNGLFLNLNSAVPHDPKEPVVEALLGAVAFKQVHHPASEALFQT